MGEVKIKSGNLCERYTSVETAQQYSASLYMFADIQPSTTYTIAFEIDEGSLQYFNENLFTYSQYYVTGTGNKQMLQLNAKANIQKTASTWSDTYGWIIAKNYTGNATVPHWKNIQLLEGTYTSETIPEYQPYFLNRPAHRYTNGQWVDIPTHHFINNRWQGELTSQSPLKFWADGEMLDWRIEGASGGVGDWDETEQKYKIPVRVEGENLFDTETSTSVYIDTRGNEHPSEKSLTSAYISVNANTMYTLGLTGDTDSKSATAYCFYDSNKEWISGSTYVPSANGNTIRLLTPNDCAYFRFTYNHLRELVEFVEGSYTTLPPYSTTTNIYTDHQLLDGDSIDYATTETQIPIATGNNILTVDTAVQPSKVFIKFEG